MLSSNTGRYYEERKAPAHFQDPLLTKENMTIQDKVSLSAQSYILTAFFVVTNPAMTTPLKSSFLNSRQIVLVE